MNKFDTYQDFSRNGVVSPIGFTKNETTTKGLIALGVVLLGITTIVFWYMISGPERFPISYLIANLFVWGTSIVIILFGYNNRNV